MFNPSHVFSKVIGCFPLEMTLGCNPQELVIKEISLKEVKYLIQTDFGKNYGNYNRNNANNSNGNDNNF